eukprot:TRINITY_DN2215_c1_g2_i1.p1 TRINITY_DN2215_c1_g2~~TRINITY_DN2215_c1_g2_i1.p1  ORF type:complete len:118 (+),score=11.56 TRINITY_DN2215_c1_g2_i1:467-820(+)
MLRNKSVLRTLTGAKLEPSLSNPYWIHRNGYPRHLVGAVLSARSLSFLVIRCCREATSLYLESKCHLPSICRFTFLTTPPPPPPIPSPPFLPSPPPLPLPFLSPSLPTFSPQPSCPP